jgi:hypothetical protein
VKTSPHLNSNRSHTVDQSKYPRRKIQKQQGNLIIQNESLTVPDNNGGVFSTRSRSRDMKYIPNVLNSFRQPHVFPHHKKNQGSKTADGGARKKESNQHVTLQPLKGSYSNLTAL